MHKAYRTPNRAAAGFFKPAASPPLPLTLRLSVARGSVNCEAATVMRCNYSIRLYSTVSTNTCFQPQGSHTRTGTYGHTNTHAQK